MWSASHPRTRVRNAASSEVSRKSMSSPFGGCDLTHASWTLHTLPSWVRFRFVRVRDLLEEAEQTLIESPSVDHWQKGRERIEAEELLDFVLGDTPDPDEEVSATARRRFRRLVARRATGEPVPLITGSFVFRELQMKVRPGVFVPRESSEWLVHQAVSRLRRRGRPVAVDLATGAGPIALAVANEVRKAEVYGTDLTAEAVALARLNAARLR